MKKIYAATLALCASMLCNAETASARFVTHNGSPAQAQTEAAPAGYTATVKSGEARFTLPVPQRREWQWRRSETKERGREYVFDVKVVNEGRTYSFGLFMWKFPGARPANGSFASLVNAGQKNVFESDGSGHNLIVRDVDVKVKLKGEQLIITVSGRKNVERLFSGRPSTVTIETIILDEPRTSQTVPVTYEN